MLDTFKRNNLKILADFLEQHYSIIAFDMEHYYWHVNKSFYWPENPYEATYECGTVACAVGHGPMAGIPAKKSEDWFPYMMRCFCDDMKQYYFMFSSDWKSVDNTPLGAAARIRYILDHENYTFNGELTLEIYKDYLKKPLEMKQSEMIS